MNDWRNMSSPVNQQNQLEQTLEEVKTLITEINKGERLPPKEKNEKTYNPFDSLRRLSVIDSKK